MRGKWLYILAILGLVGYSAVMIAPYVRSTLVRDASVTSWSRMAVAPIAGTIVGTLPAAGDTVGADGLIATVENGLLLAEQQATEAMHRRVILAKSRAREAEEHLAELDMLDARRLRSRDEFAGVFEATIEAEIENLRSELAVVGERIEVLTRITERQRSLGERGVGPQASLDEALIRLAEARARQAQIEASLKAAELRDTAAERGVFIAADGGSPDWLRIGEFEIAMEKQRVRRDLHQARSDLTEAEEGLALAQRTLDRLSSAPVTAPPGAFVFSVMATPGATVVAGTPVVEWIDCSVLLVDVPVPDAEAPLVGQGDPAEVILEGENRTRAATVRMVRGSAATLGRDDLVAIAKGRTEGVAQALLTLDAEPQQDGRCPVGRAAYVRFPDVGLVDVIRARLRL